MTNKRRPAGIATLFAPAVRVLRRMNFGSKALIISAVFTLPIVLMGVTLVRSSQQQLAQTRAELDGLRIAHALLPLIDTTSAARADAMAAAAGRPAPGDAGTRYAAQYAALAAAIGNGAARYVSADSFNRLPLVLPALPQAGSDPIEPLEIYSQVIQDELALLKEVRATSGLAEESDALARNLLHASLTGVPELAERIAYVAALGQQALKSGDIQPSQQRMVSDRLPMIEYFESEVADELQAAASLDAATKARLGEQMPSASELRGLSRRYLLGASVTGDANRFEQSARRALDGFAAARGMSLDRAEQILADREQRVSSRRLLFGGGIALCFLAAAYLFGAFFLVTRSGLNLVKLYLRRMAEGDLSRMPPPPAGSDEPAQVIEDVRRAYQAVQELIRRVQDSADELTATSTDIADNAGDLSARTHEASERLMEQAVSMQQVGAQVSSSAERAQAAAAFAEENAQSAVQGGRAISEMVDMMQEIQHSSGRIRDIISVIDGIAFQTNLLALNAAVEAAHAGDAGRGFAVVASEVRGLAHRSASAAREIAQLVTDSISKVEAGSKVAAKAGSAVEAAVGNADQISRFMGEIVTAAREQSTSVARAGAAMRALDTNSRHNLALVEQTSSTATALREHAAQLQQQVMRFRLAGH
ncbi:MAG: methyl-accepting chemotaxis protein [Telluria sp.]